VDDDFVVEAMFAMNGKLFFADLAQGLAYCDLPAADGSVVNFDFIPLPAEAQVDPSWYRWPNGSPGPSPALARFGLAQRGPALRGPVDFRAGPCRTTGPRWRPRHDTTAPRAVLARPKAQQGPTARQAHHARRAL
jgi:hypothetical protein